MYFFCARAHALNNYTAIHKMYRHCNDFVVCTTDEMIFYPVKPFVCSYKIKRTNCTCGAEMCRKGKYPLFNDIIYYFVDGVD